MRASILIVLAAGAALAAGCASRKAEIQPAAPTTAAAAAPAPAAPAPAKPAEVPAEPFHETPIVGGDAEAAARAAAAEGDVEKALKAIYFGYDSDDLSPEALRQLEANAAWLKAHPAVKVQIEGHCDARGTVSYNLALGGRRARAVRTHLARLGVAEGRLDVISYGKERPAVAGDDEAAYAKNRRAEFRKLEQ